MAVRKTYGWKLTWANFGQRNNNILDFCNKIKIWNIFVTFSRTKLLNNEKKLIIIKVDLNPRIIVLNSLSQRTKFYEKRNVYCWG